MFKYKTVLSLLLLSSFLLPHSTSANKPRPPLEIDLSSVNLSDSTTEITLKAKANTATEGVSLSIELPLGLLPIDGETTWDGPLERGASHRLVVIVEHDRTRELTIRAMAKVRLPNAGHFIQERPLILNPRENHLPSQAPPIPQGSSAGSVLEFRGN